MHTHFKYLGTIISWDLREVKDVEARIKSANKLFGSAKATFWSNARVPFELRMRFYKAIIVNVLLWGCESWAIQSKEVQAIRVTRFAILFYFMLLIFVLTDANEATYSIEFGSNFSL